MATSLPVSPTRERRTSDVSMSASCENVSSHVTSGETISGKGNFVHSASVQIVYGQATYSHVTSGQVTSCQRDCCQHVSTSKVTSGACAVHSAIAGPEPIKDDVQVVEDLMDEGDSEEGTPMAQPDSDDIDGLSTEILDEVPEVSARRHRKSTSHEEGGHRHKHRHRRKRRASRPPVERGAVTSGTRHHHERKSSRLKESAELLQMQGWRYITSR